MGARNFVENFSWGNRPAGRIEDKKRPRGGLGLRVRISASISLWAPNVMFVTRVAELRIPRCSGAAIVGS